MKYMKRCLILLINMKMKPEIKGIFFYISDWHQCEILTMLQGVKDVGKEEVLCCVAVLRDTGIVDATNL